MKRTLLALILIIYPGMSQSREAINHCDAIEQVIIKIKSDVYETFFFESAIKNALGLYRNCEEQLDEDKKKTTIMLLALAYRYSDLKDLDYVLSVINKALNISNKDSQMTPWHLELLSNKAHLLLLVGNYPESLKIEKDVLQYRELDSSTSATDLAKSYARIGSALRFLQNLSEANIYLKKSALILEKQNETQSDELAWVYNNLGNVYSRQGKNAQAVKFYERALDIFEKIYPNSHPALAGVYNNIGTIFHVGGDYEATLPIYERALSTYQKFYGEQHPRVALVLNNLGELRLDMGLADEAEQLFKESIAIRKTINNGKNADLAWTYSYIGKLYSAKDKSKSALEYYEKSITLWSELAGVVPFDRLETVISAGESALQSGKSNRASEHYSNALGNISRHLTQHLLDKDGFENAKKSATPLLHRILATLSDNDNMLHDRSILVWQIFQILGWDSVSVSSGISHIRNHSNAEQASNILKSIRHFAEFQRNSNTKALKSQADFVELFENTTVKYEQLTEEFEALYSDKKSLIHQVFPVLLDRNDITELLTQEQAIVQFEMSNDHIFTYVITQENSQLFSIKVNKGDVVSEISSMLRSVVLDDVPLISRLKPFDTIASHNVYRALFSQIQNVLAEKTDLFVVRRGELGTFPLNILLLEHPNNSNSQYSKNYKDMYWFHKQYSVSRLITLFPRKTNQNSNNDQVLLVGAPQLSQSTLLPLRGDAFNILDNTGMAVPEKIRELSSLPNATKELEASKKIAESSYSLLAENAKESLIKSIDLKPFRYIAFATHMLVATDGDDSQHGIILTPPKTPSKLDDGFLSHSEIKELNLKAELVILSGCKTASSDGLSSENLTGLASSFLYAGSDSVLVSHWSVDDYATQKLMDDFYASLNKGNGTSNSLQIAIDSYLSKSDSNLSTHPAFWGAFELVKKTIH